MNVSAAIPGGAARRGISGGRAQGRAHPCAHRQPHRPPARGADQADRLRALACGGRRPSTTMAPFPKGSLQVKNEGARCIEGRAHRRTGHVHHRPVRGHDAGGPGRGRDQGGKPGWRPYRAYQGDNYSPHFQAYNRNKRSLALDMKQPAERVLFDTLIREADVFIQNFRPGTADRLGAGASATAGAEPEADLLLHQRLRRQRSLRGSSQLRFSGAGAERIPQRGGGSGTSAVPWVRRWPTPSPASMPRMACWARCSIAAAPGAAASSRFPCSRPWRTSPSSPSPRISRWAPCRKSADRPRLAQAHILRTGDGGLIAIHLSSLEKFWTGLVAALQAPELATDPRFTTRLLRIDNYDDLGRELDQRFSQHTVAYWVERLGTADVPFAPINKVDAVVKDPQVQHLGLMVPIGEPHHREADGAACRAVGWRARRWRAPRADAQ